MNPLFEMLSTLHKNTQQNSLSQQMADQFGLQHSQAEKAIEALMPAFSQGLKRNVISGEGMAGFMQALASGSHSNYLQNPSAAFSTSGIQEGNAILGHLFGNKDVSKALAAQAEAASGVSQSILKKMLPALAPIIMGGLFNQMTGKAQSAPQAQHAFGGAGGGILGQILEQMMKGGLNTGRQGQGAPRGGNPLEEILKQMTGRGAPAGNPGNNNTSGSLGDIFNDMLKGGVKGGYQPDRGEPSDYNRQDNQNPYDQQEQSSGDKPFTYPEGTGLEDLFGEMFKPSKHSSPEYEKDVESIFDEFLGPKN